MCVVSFRQKGHVKKEISPYAVLLSANPKEYEPAPLESIKKCFLILLFILRYKVISLSSVSVNHHWIEFVARAETQDPKVWPQPCISASCLVSSDCTCNLYYDTSQEPWQPAIPAINLPFVCEKRLFHPLGRSVCALMAAREEEWKVFRDSKLSQRDLGQPLLCENCPLLLYLRYQLQVLSPCYTRKRNLGDHARSTWFLFNWRQWRDVSYANQMQIVKTGSWPRNYVILIFYWYLSSVKWTNHRTNNTKIRVLLFFAETIRN